MIISIPRRFSAPVFCRTFSQFASSSNIFSRCFSPLRFLSIIRVVVRGSSFSLFIPWPKKKVAWLLSILFMNGLVVRASSYTVLFDFCAVREILRRNLISFASPFFYDCFEIVHALHPYIRMSSYSAPGLFFLCEWRCVYLLVPISFWKLSTFALFLMRFQCCRMHRLILKYLN